MTKAKQCELGCKVFYGGERRHHKDCVYYPESFSEIYDKLKAAFDSLKKE